MEEYIRAVCEDKEKVIKLSNKELRKYKIAFYSLNLKMWELDVLWNFIWNDISLDEVYEIFKIGGSNGKIRN